ncbi:hypothetical protein CaCOL14_008726 [Colletotrichum acutatum]|uniref:Uncharacterized protein n=1 Tax=Glomerella acutata TaxID=27357 RepID=A0AAD8UUS3_GLOAC|nr:uncharacterized protein BDZ83DRAFT_649565 [Colletotrichum acutatum]KAK1727449.1 hypothetical protein BDZ83DRAFT_649565 [Colletotrichum acutatum]
MATPRLVPTFEMPLMNDVKARLLEALDRGDSLYTISLMFPDIARDVLLLTCSHNSTVDQLENDCRHGRNSLMLLHAIPRKLLRSLIQGTLAFDAVHSRDASCYPEKGQGIYAIDVYIENRGGKFLSHDEITSVIAELKGYIKAYRINSRTLQGHQRDIGDRMLVKKAYAFDDAFGTSASDKTRLITNAADVFLANNLVKALQRRQRVVTDSRHFRVHQIQGMPYVGCSGDLETRVPGYRTNNALGGKRTLDPASINTPLILLLSAIKVIGLVPKTVSRVILKTWEPGLLPMAERLVISLAHSNYAQDGLNVAEGGGQRGKDKASTMRQVESEVLCVRPFFNTNMQLSLADLEQRRVFLDNLEAIDGARGEILKLSREYDMHKLTLDRLLKQWETELKKVMKSKTDSLRLQHTAVTAEELQWQRLDDITMRVCLRLGIEDDEDEEDEGEGEGVIVLD